MDTNLQEQASELEHERMISMQLQIVIKNKEVEIINLEKRLEELESTNFANIDKEEKDEFDENDSNL